jgi:hypothetical protein
MYSQYNNNMVIKMKSIKIVIIMFYVHSRLTKRNYREHTKENEKEISEGWM